MKDQGYEGWSSMVLRRYLKTIQSAENSFEVSRHCKMEEYVEKGRKMLSTHRRGCLKHPYAWIHVSLRMNPCAPTHGTTIITAPCTPVHQTMRLAYGHGHEVLFSCFSSRFWLKNPIFTLLTPNLSCAINRDSFKLFYSFRNVAEQVKGQASRASR